MSYFEPKAGGIMPPVVKNILIINGLLFLATMVLLEQGVNLYKIFAWHDSNDFKIWQPISYMFMHADFGHIFFNMFGVWMFGIQLENLWGPKRFLNYYLLTGLGAGIIHFMLFDGSLVGASGSLMGLLLAFGVIFPNARLLFLFFPVPIKAKYFVILYGIGELYYGFTSDGNIAHFAHIGGMLIGFLILKYWKWKNK